MKRFNIYLALAAMLLAVACTQDPVPAGEGAITIEASVGAPTKVTADGTSFAAGDEILVYAWLGSEPVVPAERVVNGVRVTLGNDGTWTPAKTMLWAPGQDPHHFLGIYPVPTEPIGEFTAVPYTLDPAPEAYAASDLLLATTPTGIVPSGDAVELIFRHMMAKLVFNLRFRSEFTTAPEAADVTLTVEAKTGATIDYPMRAVTAIGDASDVPVAIASVAPTGYDLCFSGLMVPQSGVRRISLTVGGKKYVLARTEDIPLASGKYTTLGLIVGKDKLEIGEVTVADWTEAPALAVAVPDDDGNMLATPLTLEAAVEGAVVNFDICTEVATRPVYFRTWNVNDPYWTDWAVYADNSDVPLASIGDKVQFKSDNAAYGFAIGDWSSWGCSFVTLSAGCYVYGNIMSLVGGDDFDTCFTLTADHTFISLFAASGINNENPVLFHPTKQLLLPATTLTDYCYYNMFSFCTSLTSLPEDFLPATILANGCYGFMFDACSGLTSLPDGLLPAGKDGIGALAESCYEDMFQDCDGLTTLPMGLLPATTLAESCYDKMFHNCNNLQNSPVLLASNLVYTCYRSMFAGCSKLNSVTCLATDITLPYSLPGSSVLSSWLSNAGIDVVGTKTVYTMPPSKMVDGDWEMYPSNNAICGIPEGWTRQYVDVSGTQDFTFGTPGTWQ